MSIRFWMAAPAAIMIVLGAAACGSDSDSSSGSADTSTTGDVGTTGTDGTDGTDGTNGTDGTDGTDGAVSSKYYDGTESAALGSANNQATCSTCHSNDGSAGYAGDSLKNIAYLSSYKGGDAPTLLDASNACVTGWMGGEALAEGDAEWTSLKAYFESISDSSVTTPNTLAPEVLADEAAYEAAYAGGDSTAGEASYQLYCARCHSGELSVSERKAYTLDTLKAFSVGRIAQKVRTSGPPPSGMSDSTDTTPGPMPFFEPDELDATALKDIIAYIKG